MLEIVLKLSQLDYELKLYTNANNAISSKRIIIVIIMSVLEFSGTVLVCNTAFRLLSYRAMAESSTIMWTQL